MNLIVEPGHPLRGSLRVAGDKSLSHRAALLGSLANGTSHVHNFLDAGVTRAMLGALSDLGIYWTFDGSNLKVEGAGLTGYTPPKNSLFCGNSATTMRLLAGALACSGTPAVLDGTEGLRRRPMNRIVEPLQAMGALIQTSSGGTAPLRHSGRHPEKPLHALTYRLAVASAQVKSCLLLAALHADGPSILYEPGPSRDHTERMLEIMGVPVESRVIPVGFESNLSQIQISITPPEDMSLKPLDIDLPGDFSAAAFLLVAGLTIPGSEILLKDVGLNPTRTGLLDVLQKMGGDISVQRTYMAGSEPAGDILVRYSHLEGIDVPASTVVRMIDEFPAFAVAAALAQGETSVHGAGELRHKESDRISSLREMQNIGVIFEETPDGFTISGKDQLTGGEVDGQKDHRIAMALCIAGLAAQDRLIVRGAEIINESFPDFIEAFTKLGASLYPSEIQGNE